MEKASTGVAKVAVGIAVLFFLLPLVGLLLRTPRELGTELASPPVRSALGLSLICSLAATAISLVFGVPLAWALARWEFPGKSVVRALTTLPMIAAAGGRRRRPSACLRPPRVRRAGLLDQAFGIALHHAGAILAETFVAMPFLVMTVEAGAAVMNRRFEDAASRWAPARGHVRAGDAAADRAESLGRGGAGLGPGAR